MARFILALWVEMPPDKSGNFARNDTSILLLRGDFSLCRCEAGEVSRSNLGGIPHLRLEQFPLTVGAGLYIIPVEE